MLKILEGLRLNKLPQSFFDETAKKVLETSVYEDLPRLVMIDNLTSPYCQLLYYEAAKIRHFQAGHSKLDSREPLYAVSRQLLRLMVSSMEKSKAEDALEKALSQLPTASEGERAMLFELLDSSITLVSQSDYAVMNSKAFAEQSRLITNEPREVVSEKPG